MVAIHPAHGCGKEDSLPVASGREVHPSTFLEAGHPAGEDVQGVQDDGVSLRVAGAAAPGNVDLVDDVKLLGPFSGQDI